MISKKSAALSSVVNSFFHIDLNLYRLARDIDYLFAAGQVPL